MIPDSSYNPDGSILRVSKSSLMCYLKCPRQYWWRYVGMPDIRAPPTPEMLRGSDVHDSIDKYFETGEIDTLDGDAGIEAFLEISNELESLYPQLSVVEHENKYEVHYQFEDEDGKFEAVLVGIVDFLMNAFEEEEYVIGETKTGNMASSKLGRTRQELAFYHILLSLTEQHSDTNFTHFAYLALDSQDTKVYVAESAKRNKHLLSGSTQGLLLVEKINKRSLNSMEKKLRTAIKAIYAEQWPMKWSEYYCPQWCDFCLNCDSEINGLTEPVV